jgi:FMN phosphatase YigB (HAD superfamily)
MPVKNVKLIVWDVDGTLYSDNPPFEEAVFKMKKRVANTYGIRGTSDQYAMDCERYYMEDPIAYGKVMRDIEEKAMTFVDTGKYIHEDIQLKRVFTDLKDYRHCILSNSTHTGVMSVLKALKINPNIFKQIVTSDDFYTKKNINRKSESDTSAFEYTIKKMRCHPRKVVSVGDRPSDMAAKELGCWTILCGMPKMMKSEKKHVDWEARDAYDIPAIIDEIEYGI